MVHDHAAVRAERALAACTEASERAEQVLDDRSEPSYPIVQTHLAAAVVELREADDAAAGELWPAEIDPTESPPRSSVPTFSWSGSSGHGDATRSAARARSLIQAAGLMVTLTCFTIGWSLWVL